MPSDDSSKRIFERRGDDAFVFNRIITHQGKVVAFALTKNGRFVYNILNLDGTPHDTDATAWADDLIEVPFPNEVGFAGAELVAPFVIPTVDNNGASVKADDPTLDKFASSSAIVTNVEMPFEVLEDGQYLYLFRATVGKDHAKNIKFDGESRLCAL